MEFSVTTTNHEEIKQWAEENSGRPQIIDDKEAQADIKGIRITFKDEKQLLRDDIHRDISWDQFFKIFEENKLALQYYSNYKGDDMGIAYRFVRRDEE